MNKKMSSEGCVLALVWFVLLIVFGVILEGYVIKELWGWFIVPTFSAPILNIRSAIGIALVATALQPTPETNTHDKSEPWWSAMLEVTIKVPVRWGFILLVGYMVYAV